MPTAERRKAIIQTVNQIKSKHTELNFVAFDIVKFLKGKEDFAIASKLMTDDTTGMLFVDDENFIPDTDTHKLIVTNSLLQEQEDFIQRRRFIIAHEYAHYILHKHDKSQYAHRDTSNRNAPLEKEADFFARCLLMPSETIDIILNLDFVRDTPFENKVSLISRVFNVTKKKAKQRLEEDLQKNE